MKRLGPILLVCGFICGVAAYSLRFWLWVDAFYHLIALEFVFLYGVIWLYATGKWKLVCQIFLLTCLNSLLDELFFDPTEITLNEYIGFGIIIITTLLYAKKFFKRLGD